MKRFDPHTKLEDFDPSKRFYKEVEEIKFDEPRPVEQVVIKEEPKKEVLPVQMIEIP